MATRNIQLEQKALGEFVKAQGKEPSTPEDWKLLHTYAYGKEIPSELSSLPMYSKGEQASTNPNANIGQPLYFQGADVSDTSLAGARTAYNELSTPNSFLSQVKERLATKFKPDSVALSIDPFSATLGELNPSQALNGLALQSQAVRRKGVLALQALTTASDIYGERATNALNNLNQLEAKRTAFETEQKATETELKSLALELAKKGKDLPEDLLNLLPANLRSVYKAMPAIFKEETSWSGINLGGGTGATGGVVKTATGDAYDIGSYATDPNHEKAVQGILQNIGQFKTVNDINNYITTKYPSSPVTGEMVAKASEKYGVSWEMITAIMEQDSSMGTAGKAVRTFNPGNVGNTDSGAEVNYKDWQSGVDAVAENLAGRKTTATTDTTKTIPAFDNIISQGLSASEEMARIKALAGGDEKRAATLTAQFDAYKASKVKPDSTADAKALAKQIFDGTSSLDVKSLPTAKREEVDKELSALKAEAKASGSIIGLIKSSAGGKEVDSTFMTSFDKALNTIAQVSDLQQVFSDDKKMKKNYGVDLNPITNIWRSKNPYDTKAKTISAQLAAIVPNLARGIYGEVGVLTDNDIKIYSQTLPSLGSTEDVRKAVLGITIKSIQRSIENKLKTQAGGSRDVSGYMTQYNEVSALADKLLSEAGITKNSSWNIEPANFKDLSKFEQ